MYRTAGRPEPSPRYVTTFVSTGTAAPARRSPALPGRCVRRPTNAYEAVVTERDDAKRAGGDEPDDRAGGQDAGSPCRSSRAWGIWAVNPKRVGQFKPIPGRHEFGDVSSGCRAPSRSVALSPDGERPERAADAALHPPPSRSRARVLLVVLALVVFALARVTGNPADLLLPEDATPEDRAQLMRDARARSAHARAARPLPRPARCAAISGSRSATGKPGRRDLLRAPAEHAHARPARPAGRRWSWRSRSACWRPSIAAPSSTAIAERHRRARHRHALASGSASC